MGHAPRHFKYALKLFIDIARFLPPNNVTDITGDTFDVMGLTVISDQIGMPVQMAFFSVPVGDRKDCLVATDSYNVCKKN